jgi:hypothetical protein
VNALVVFKKLAVFFGCFAMRTMAGGAAAAERFACSAHYFAD